MNNSHKWIRRITSSAIINIKILLVVSLPPADQHSENFNTVELQTMNDVFLKIKDCRFLSMYSFSKTGKHQ